MKAIGPTGLPSQLEKKCCQNSHPENIIVLTCILQTFCVLQHNFATYIIITMCNNDSSTNLLKGYQIRLRFSPVYVGGIGGGNEAESGAGMRQLLLSLP